MKALRLALTVLLWCVSMIIITPAIVTAQDRQSKPNNPGNLSATERPALKIPEFSNQAEKDAWFRRNVGPHMEISNPNDPTAPKLILTGDTQKDHADYEARKQRWLREKEAENRKKEFHNQPTDPRPVFVDTGNPEKDITEYNSKKAAWIKANQQYYDSINK